MKITLKKKKDQSWKEVLVSVQKIVKPKTLNVTDDILEFVFDRELSNEEVKLIKGVIPPWWKFWG